MPLNFRRNLFWGIVLSSVFCTLPRLIQLNFLGSSMGTKLTIYPLLVGIVLTIFFWLKGGRILSKESKFVLFFFFIYGAIIFISLIHGLAVYPYYNDVLNGPMNQIEKLPKVYDFLRYLGFSINEKKLLELWMVARPIKGFIFEIFWTFGISYMIYCWYHRNWKEGFSIMRKALLWCIILIVLYSILDILYLYGIWGAETALDLINPLVHDIKQDGTWWPPLVWPGQLRSLFAEPSYFGIFAAFAMPWLWYSIYIEKSRRSKIVLSILFAFYAICLFLTRARTANALFLGEILLFGLAGISFRKELLKIFIILAALAVMALGISSFAITNFLPGSPERAQIVRECQENLYSLDVSGYLSDNLGSLASDNKRSNLSRYSILKADLGIGMDHPIFGVGRSLRNAYITDYLPKEAFNGEEIQMWIKNQKEKGIMRSGFPSLGEYSSRFAETGILGLIIYLIPAIILVYRLLIVIHNKTLKPGDRLPYVFFLISILGVLASGFGDGINITYAYWLLLGIGYAMCFGEKTIGSVIESK